jgi:uncharacterized protein (DUF1919 family)
MSNSLMILSNTNIRFEEPEEVVESVIERLNNYPFGWKFIYKACDPVRRSSFTSRLRA